jgi:hypothetical protein
MSDLVWRATAVHVPRNSSQTLIHLSICTNSSRMVKPLKCNRGTDLQVLGLWTKPKHKKSRKTRKDLSVFPRGDQITASAYYLYPGSPAIPFCFDVFSDKRLKLQYRRSHPGIRCSRFYDSRASEWPFHESDPVTESFILLAPVPGKLLDSHSGPAYYHAVENIITS